MRFGFAASPALRVGTINLVMIGMQQDRPHTSAPQTVSPADQDCFEVVMARQAYPLVHQV